MGAVPILVKWSEVKEVIHIDFEKVLSGEQITRTSEMGLIDGKHAFWHYNVTSKPKPNGAGVTLTIRYTRDENLHLRGTDWRWGHSELQLDPAMKEGRIHWFDDVEDRNDRSTWVHSGAANWRRLIRDASLFTERDTEEVLRKARQQARLKLELLMIDPFCALTEESEVAALEAAHIIPVKGGGSDVSSNAFLLRVDLHRLFDARLIDLDETGKVIVSADLKSNYYSNYLAGRRLNQKTLDRIRTALRRANPRGSPAL